MTTQIATSHLILRMGSAVYQCTTQGSHAIDDGCTFNVLSPAPDAELARIVPRPEPTEGDIPMHGWSPYGEVHRERIRAHAKHSKSGKSCEQMGPDDSYWLAVLLEEVGEVANALIESRLGTRDGFKKAREELIQVAAMATAWIDAIDGAR